MTVFHLIAHYITDADNETNAKKEGEALLESFLPDVQKVLETNLTAEISMIVRSKGGSSYIQGPLTIHPYDVHFTINGVVNSTRQEVIEFLKAKRDSVSDALSIEGDARIIVSPNTEEEEEL